jgi:hypothetical protein
VQGRLTFFEAIRSQAADSCDLFCMGRDSVGWARSTTALTGTVVNGPLRGAGESDERVPSSAADGATGVAPVAWLPEVGMDVRRWVAYGKRFARMSSASSWWIGDWMRYGNAQYGERYGAASKATGYDRQTLMNMAYVSSRFSIERRRASVPWSHHAELAALPAADQDAWLNLAEREHLTVRSLREEVRRGLNARRKTALQVAARDDTAEVAVNVCPHCGRPMPATQLTSPYRR